MATATAPRPTLGPISRDEVYPQPVFQTLTGLGKHALAMAKRRGLKSREVGNRVYIAGSDWHSYLASIEA